MKKGWITISVLFFLSLFIPISLYRDNVQMFWDYFDISAKIASWHIVNAVFGIVIFVIAILFTKGIVRGAVMAGCGFIALIIYMALVAVGRGTDATLMLLGQISVAVMFGGCLLQKQPYGGLTARLLAGIGGGCMIIFFFVSIIVMLVNTGGHWTSIVGNIVVTLFTIPAIVAGILCLIRLGNKAPPKLINAAQMLTLVYILCYIGWQMIRPILTGLASYSFEAGPVFVDSLRNLVNGMCIVGYIILLSVGFVELYRGIFGTPAST